MARSQQLPRKLGIAWVSGATAGSHRVAGLNSGALTVFDGPSR
ncbi:hypothetical protein C1Y40_04459 [Mycobacterium talmoniae]|uniref:Uncharacterized protein n=1 Tax=Mycobacterium talmoniae TaxID=1858794 RepID=A0A2S8BFH7_9MYCO|nr:hypothetical protein C1Y40_04459 [Mycobacterium talmoniae]